MALSGVRLMLNRLNPFSASIYPPSIIKVLMKTIDFSSESYRREVADAANLYIRLPLEGFRFDDFKRSAEMAGTAYREAAEIISQWTAQTQPSRGKRPHSQLQQKYSALHLVQDEKIPMSVPPLCVFCARVGFQRSVRQGFCICT